MEGIGLSNVRERLRVPCGADFNLEIVSSAGGGTIIRIDIPKRHEMKTAQGIPTFAGVSQDARRFAVEFSEVRGDPPMPLYDHFVIYDAETAKPIAMVRIVDLPEYYSRSTFSPDGNLFVAGGRLTRP